MFPQFQLASMVRVQIREQNKELVLGYKDVSKFILLKKVGKESVPNSHVLWKNCGEISAEWDRICPQICAYCSEDKSQCQEEDEKSSGRRPVMIQNGSEKIPQIPIYGTIRSCHRRCTSHPHKED